MGGGGVVRVTAGERWQTPAEVGLRIFSPDACKIFNKQQGV